MGVRRRAESHAGSVMHHDRAGYDVGAEARKYCCRRRGVEPLDGSDLPGGDVAQPTAATASAAMLRRNRRAYGVLNATSYPKQTSTDAYNSAFPIPKGEVAARNGNIAVTCT